MTHEEFLRSLGEVLDDYVEPSPLPDVQTDEWFEKRLGNLISDAGGSRTVYHLIDDETLVIKKIKIGYVGANTTEFSIWTNVKDSPLKDTFGRITAVSETGRFIAMERLDDLPEDFDMTKTPDIPSWLKDVWPNNFGISASSGAAKVRDYAMIDFKTLLTKATLTRCAWQKR